MSKSKGVVVKKVRALERLRDSGRLRRVGQSWTTAAWLTHWLETIARPSLRHTSLAAYRIAVEKHLVPGVGKHRLDRLEPEHLERLYKRMVERGSRPATAHQVHRTARVALGEALRRGHIARNPAALAKPPRIQSDPIEPYSVARCRRSYELRGSAGTRLGGRWLWLLACVRVRRWLCAGRTWIWTATPCGSGRHVNARCTRTAAAATASVRLGSTPRSG